MYSPKQKKCRGTEKQRLSSQVLRKLGDIDEGFHCEGCADSKTCWRSPICRLRD